MTSDGVGITPVYTLYILLYILVMSQIGIGTVKDKALCP